MHTVKVELIKKHREVEEQLDLLKQEYARLYEETMPELIPEYIHQNQNLVDNDTLAWGQEYLTRTKRDVQFLLNVMEKSQNPLSLAKYNSRNGAQINPNSKFSEFTKAFARRTHNRRTHNSQIFSPDNLNSILFNSTTRNLTLLEIQSCPNTTTTPPTLTTTTTQSPEFFSDLTVSSFNLTTLSNLNTSINSFEDTLTAHNRTKRFLPALALASGVLGTFFGLFNANEINKLRADLNDMRSRQNLLIQITKTQEMKEAAHIPPQASSESMNE